MHELNNKYEMFYMQLKKCRELESGIYREGVFESVAGPAMVGRSWGM